MAIGIAAMHRSEKLAVQAAVVVYIALFSLGVAIGHVEEAVEAGDFAANNFGLLLLITVTQMILLPILLRLAGEIGTQDDDHHHGF